MVVIAVVGSVVGHLVLDTGPWGAGVTAAEGDPIHKVLPVHVAVDSAAEEDMDTPFTDVSTFYAWHTRLEH